MVGRAPHVCKTKMFIYRVSDITRHLKDLLDSDELLQDLWVAGEVSNLSRAPSGHLYFTVKDADSQLACVMWRSQVARLAALPKDGDHVILHGYITIYENRGVYQFYADMLQAEGIGLLAAQFEELKARLAAEGLFDAAHKRPLPALPRCIGIVTSTTGAVLHDMLNILRRRYRLARLLIAPSAVQGADAPRQIVAALSALQAVGTVDVIIVARGGGSLEDLWAFNDETVARAIYNCTVPVISAVGHEVDYTIADFVADLRAPTPSAAAELVAPDQGELAARVESSRRRLLELMRAHVQQGRSRVAAEQRALLRLSPRLVLDQQRQRVDDLWQRARAVIGHELLLRREHTRGLGIHLQALSPLAVLQRGFAIVWRAGGREVVSQVQQVRSGDALQIQVSNGRFAAVVGGDGARKRNRHGGNSEQLSLGLDGE
jgi:exodeoxyribonuclease VII large subunit